jgi:hypothetical protein
MGDKWDISVWTETGEGTDKYVNLQIARGNGDWEEMLAALEMARTHGKPITMVWREG